MFKFQRCVTTRLRSLTGGRGIAVPIFFSVMAAALGVGALTVARAAAPTGETGMIQTVAGSVLNYTYWGYSGDGGPATDAQLYNPRAVAFGSNGDVFIADALNERIRKIDTNGIITTFAGSGPPDSGGTLQNGSTPTGTNGDGGPATSAVFNQPHGVAVDSKGNVYVADSGNHRIRKIDTNGVITTIAGTGDPRSPEGANGSPASAAGLKFPKSMFMAANDQLYVADSGNNMIRFMDLNANPPTITTVAGTAQSKRYGGDGGKAVNAQLNTPEGLWVTTDGTIYIADSDNNLIRKVDPAGKISTIAGDAAAAAAAANARTPVPPTDSAGDGGAATSAHLNVPRGIAADSLGNIYIAEEGGARIRRIDPSGIITTIAGDGTTSGRGQVAGHPGPVPAGQAQFNTIHDLNIDSDGNLWIADSKNNLVRVVFDPAHASALDTPSTPPSTTPPSTSPPPSPTPGTAGGSSS